MLRIEPLETRDLLSLVLPGYALPHYVALGAENHAAPMSTAGPTGYSPAQIRHAYGFDQISFANGTVAGDGSGTTIAIVDAYDDPRFVSSTDANFLNSDLHKFDVQFGLPDPVFTKVSQTGSTTALPRADAGWATEIALDVQWAHAIAPKANILLVEANDNSYANLLAAVDYARRASGVVVVSMSWGGGEFLGEGTYDKYFTTPSGHGGVTFLASSGDSGAPAGYPAISPNVVAVGGTTLNLDSQGNFISESGWSGSGGGLSSYESQPAYQKGVVTQSSTRRANPDVAYDSNPNTGFPVYDSYNNPVSAPWGQWGGTSDAAPQWAGLIAIADQGRALAGLGALDGATQTLPMLYALPSGDFHDITSGTSNGFPKYSAGSGYDLVTGRGSPYANLVVSDLVGASTSASTHFSITAPSGSTAGNALSITVSALDSSNNGQTGYRGTVHLTSSDTAAVLPADYTFTSGDNGAHVFSGVTLKTAGSQSITATDTSTAAIAGSAAVLVTPAAADHLAFGQQPSNAAPGAVISPAVTVKVLDAYNNLLTSDSTDRVTLVIGTNPSGGVLSGTTTIAASSGVATFSNLSISAAGNGYTLVASSGSMSGATSAGFNVTTSTVIEGFETSSTYYVVGATTPTAYISTTAKHDGTYGLVDSPGSDWIYRNDAAAQVKQGDTISVWLRFAGAADGRAYFGFGASAAGTLSLVAARNTNQLLIQNNSGYGFTNIGSASQTWLANHWYRLEVNWGTSGAIVGKLFDSNGTTLLRTVSASTTAITSGGIAFRAIGNYNKYWDTVQLTPGVNQFSAKAATALVATGPPGSYRSAADPADGGPIVIGGGWSAAERTALATWFQAFGSDAWAAGSARADGVPAGLFARAADQFFQEFFQKF
jgi:subtilase family serine protease